MAYDWYTKAKAALTAAQNAARSTNSAKLATVIQVAQKDLSDASRNLQSVRVHMDKCWSEYDLKNIEAKVAESYLPPPGWT